MLVDYEDVPLTMQPLGPGQALQPDLSSITGATGSYCIEYEYAYPDEPSVTYCVVQVEVV